MLEIFGLLAGLLVVFSPIILIIVIVVAATKSTKKHQPASTITHQAAAPQPTLSYQQGYTDALVAMRQAAERGGDTGVIQLVHELQAETEKGLVTMGSTAISVTTPSPTAAAWQPAQPERAGQPPAPSETPVMSQESSIDTLNALLFAGTLLILGSAGAFVAAVGDPVTKVATLIVATVLCYFGGIGLYKLVEKVRPVALALIGLSMALVPMIGLVLHSAAGMDATVAWLVVSVVAVLSYIGAAVTLQSSIVAYLSIAAFISMMIAFSRTMTDGVVWMFVPLAVVAITAQLIRMIWRRVPEYFQQPFDVTSALLSVVMVVFALPLITSSLSLREFEVLLVLALVQYGLLFYQHRKLEYEIVWRVMAAVLVAIYIGHDVAAQDTSLRVAGWMLAAMTLIGGSLLRWNTVSERRMVEVTMAWIGTAVLWLAICVALFSTPLDAWLSLACLFVVIGSAAALSYRHDDRSYMYSAVIAILFVPAIALRALEVTESLRMVTLGWYCLVISAIGMMIYGIAARQMPRTKFWLLTAIVLHAAYGFAVATTNVQELALTLYFVLAAVFFYQVAYIERDARVLYVAAGAACLLVVRLLFDVMGHQWSNWMLIVAMMTTGTLHWVGAQYSARQYAAVAKILHSAAIMLFSVAVITGLVTLMGAPIGIRLLTSLAALLLAGALGQWSMSYMDRHVGECAMYAGIFALLHAVIVLDETRVISPLVYAHIVAAGIVGAARLYVGEPRTHRCMVAAAIVSFMLTIYALGGGQTYLLLYLVEHALLAVAGAVFRQKWATMGGGVMLIFGMIYMLREVQVILLLMVGLGLIGYVIWRLSRPAK